MNTIQGLLIHGEPHPSTLASLLPANWRGRILATEGRPLLGGATVTAPALQTLGYDLTLITDSMIAYCMWRGLVQAAVISYWDQSSGGLLAPIGSLAVALCAKAHALPLFAVQAVSQEIPAIIQQDLSHFLGHRIAAEGVETLAPGHDLVPVQFCATVLRKSGPIGGLPNA